MSQTLDELVEVLGVIQEMANQGREAFDADHRQRWSIERPWIFAGNLAGRHCRVLGIDEGADPWSELIATRNVYCHYTPSAISYDRVWADTLADTPRLLGAVTAEQHRQ